MMYHGELLDGHYSAGIESLEVRLFEENEIPWDNIAFTVIEKTIKLYFKDKKQGRFGVHFDTIDKR